MHVGNHAQAIKAAQRYDQRVLPLKAELFYGERFVPSPASSTWRASLTLCSAMPVLSAFCFCAPGLGVRATDE